MSDSEKDFQLLEQITALNGVESAEVYRKRDAGRVYDILVKTSNGHMIEGTVKCQESLIAFHNYLQAVIALEGHYFRNYPNIEKEHEAPEKIQSSPSSDDVQTQG